MKMRAFHRWFGLVSAVLLTFIALTGLALQVDLIVTGNPVPGSEHVADPAPVALPAARAIGDLTARAIDAARLARPALSINHVELSFTPQGPRALVGLPGPFADHVMSDPVTGRVLPEHRMTPGWHGWLQDLHAGYRFGIVGRLLSAAMAIALLVLSVTGLVVYVDLYRRRWRAGRRALFWTR